MFWVSPLWGSRACVAPSAAPTDRPITAARTRAVQSHRRGWSGRLGSCRAHTSTSSAASGAAGAGPNEHSARNIPGLPALSRRPAASWWSTKLASTRYSVVSELFCADASEAHSKDSLPSAALRVAIPPISTSASSGLSSSRGPSPSSPESFTGKRYRGPSTRYAPGPVKFDPRSNAGGGGGTWDDVLPCPHDATRAFPGTS